MVAGSMVRLQSTWSRRKGGATAWMQAVLCERHCTPLFSAWKPHLARACGQHKAPSLLAPSGPSKTIGSCRRGLDKPSTQRHQH